MNLSDSRSPVLLTPGPLTTALPTRQAMLRDFGSRDDEFIAITARVRRRLVALVGGDDTHTAVLLQGSGTYAVEAAIGTLVPRTGKAAVLVNGAYGRRIVEILRRVERRCVAVEWAEDAPCDPAEVDRLLASDPDVTDVVIVFTETTTGMRNPLEAISAVVARHGRRLIVDAMSAFGALPLDLRTLPIDAVCASSNKCLEGVPGIGFVIARTERLRECAGNAPSLCLDLTAQWQGFEQNGQWRFTPPTHVLAALDRALELHEVEGGVEGRGRRYFANQRALVDGMRALGFETLLPDHLASPTIVTFRMPSDAKFQFSSFYAKLRDRGYVIYPGKLTGAETFRIGCIGDITPETIRGALAAVRAVLCELGVASGRPESGGLRPAARAGIEVNGRRYRWPKRPTVVVCLDGCAPDYLEEAGRAGKMPNLMRMAERGTRRTARCVIPSFTNPNNVSIVTGAPPSVHGIAGNYFIDPRTSAEVMMNEPDYLRAPTLLAAFADAGANVVAITAKDKLRRLLGHRLRGVCFSSEKADCTTLYEHGIEGVPELVGMAVPDVYSAELSEFVLRAGAKLLERHRPDLVYLSTTDYVQHKHAPGTEPANAFYAMIDRYLGELDALGATVVLTADHGMSGKTDGQGQPNVVYLGDVLDEWLGAGRARVILPITDPYVAHHGALGSFAWVHLPFAARAEQRHIEGRLARLPGVMLVLDRREAVRRFELPADRVGDLAVVAHADVVLGTSAARHDLSGLDRPLRSHGGLAEECVPLWVNRQCPSLPPDADLRNFDAFFVALNLAE